MNETDMELLEAYLDGELPMSEAGELWTRLSAEPKLSAALDQLRAQRAQRMSIWESHEPSDLEAKVVTGRVESAIRKHKWLDRVRMSLAYAVGVAACLGIGFNIGWFERGGINPTEMQAAPMVQPTNANTVAIRDQNGNLLDVPVFTSPEQASQFTRDVNAIQTQPPEQQRQSGDNVVPASDEQLQF